MLPDRSAKENVSKETHPACRSLIQKAVRRGDVSLTIKVASHLREIGDANWLRRRAAVITFEECWPLGTEFDLTDDFANTVNALVRVAKSVKVKDATGLGTLAYILSTGNNSVLSGSPEDYHIKVVSEAIKRPKDFWEWVVTKCSQEEQHALVKSAQKAHRRGGWPWDKAFMQAAAYIAITEGLPAVRTAKRKKLKEFPLWIALDKHTPQGKQGLREAAKNIGIPWYQLFWVSFYFESAITNEEADSYWWSREVRWRLHSVGLDVEKARVLWYKAQPIVSRILTMEAEQLQYHLATTAAVQMNLFDHKSFVLDKEQPLLSQETYWTNQKCSKIGRAHV